MWRRLVWAGAVLTPVIAFAQVTTSAIDTCGEAPPCIYYVLDANGKCVARYKTAGTSCTNENPCKTGDRCNSGGICLDGTSNAPNGTACVDSNYCTANDKCSSGVCVGGTTYRAAGTSCNDANYCTYTDKCNATGGCIGTPITCVDVECEKRTCNGSSACSTSTKPLGSDCRASAGACDVADKCDGVARTCPNQFAEPTILCRPSAGVCDAEEYCTGASALCPGDAPMPDGRPCGSINGCTCSAARCFFTSGALIRYQYDATGGLIEKLVLVPGAACGVTQ